MATKNIEMNIKNSSNTYDKLYPQTSSSNLIMPGGEDFTEYLEYDRQYKVGDTLTTARPASDFNNEWMVCDGSEVPGNYTINGLLESNDPFGSSKRKNVTANATIEQIINTKDGIIGLSYTDDWDNTVIRICSDELKTWNVVATLPNRLYESFIYYAEEIETYFVFGSTSNPFSGVKNINCYVSTNLSNGFELKAKNINFNNGFVTERSFAYYSNNFLFLSNHVDIYYSTNLGETFTMLIHNNIGISNLVSIFYYSPFNKFYVLGDDNTGYPKFLIIDASNLSLDSFEFTDFLGLQEGAFIYDDKVYLITNSGLYLLNFVDFNNITATHSKELTGMSGTAGTYYPPKVVINITGETIMILQRRCLYYGKAISEIEWQTNFTNNLDNFVIVNNGYLYTGYIESATIYYYKLIKYLPESPTNPTGLTTMIKVN